MKPEFCDFKSIKKTPRLTMKPSDRVLIVGKHPHTGFTGVIVELMNTPVGEMWRVELDNGLAAGVKDKNLLLLSKLSGARQ